MSSDVVSRTRPVQQAEGKFIEVVVYMHRLRRLVWTVPYTTQQHSLLIDMIYTTRRLPIQSTHFPLGLRPQYFHSRELLRSAH